MDKCQTIQTGIFLDNLFPQKPAVSQPQSTWVQQFCLIFQFPEFLANKNWSVCDMLGAMAVPPAGLPCLVALPELFPCAASEVMSLTCCRQGYTTATKLGSWGLSAAESWFHETEFRPSNCLAQFPAWLPALFPAKREALGANRGAPNTSH